MVVSKEPPNDGNNEAMAKLVGPAEETSVEPVMKEPLPDEEERIPTILTPSSQVKPISTEEANLAPTTTSTTIEPMVTAETGEAPVADLSNAEEIARRVFSAPVEGESNLAAITAEEVPVGQPKELATATSNTEDAPVTSPSTAPSTSITEPSATSTKPEASVAARIAPLAPAAVTPITETTVSGPSTGKSSKEKDSKVSSWIKTKFSRRASKATPSAKDSGADSKPTISEPRDPKVFIGGANLGAPEVTTAKTSSDQGESSMREVAMAGRNAGPVDASIVSPTEPEEPIATGAVGHRHDDDDSTSISSLSSDEDTRGRSAIRLADTMPGNHQAPIFGSTNATHDRPAAAAGHAGGDSTIGEPMDPALPTSSDKEGQSSSMGDGTDDFEEAKDTFDSERLVPPEKGLIGGESRKSDSPARDSKFVEAL